MRGIVVLPKIDIHDGTGATFHTTYIESQDLRKYLLFWDKLDYPNNNLFNFGDSIEQEFLIKSGILQRTNYSINSFSGNVGELLLNLQYQTFNNNNNKERGVWSIAQTSNKLILNSNDLANKRGIELELINCVPIPINEVPLETILEFKERRYDELLAYRNVIDDAYLQIIESIDNERAKEKFIREIQQNTANLIRVMNESKIKTILNNLKTEFSLTDFVKGVGTGFLASEAFDFSTIVGLAVGGVLSTVNIKIDNLFQPKEVPENLKPYAYIYHSQVELK